MKKKISLLLLICALLQSYTVTASVYPYTAVVKSPVAGVYKGANAVSASLLTQAIYNESVSVLGKSGAFARVKVLDGYEGYMRFADLTGDLRSLWVPGNKVIIKLKSADIFNVDGKKIITAPMSATFYGKQEGDKYAVTLPENVMGYINKDDAMFISRDAPIPLTNGEAFAETAKLFVGTNYLWGGCSSLGGIDCSGLTYISAKMNGFILPRDSSPQSKTGEPVSFEEAVIGDQIFFSAEPGKTVVTHTGIYLGDGWFVHSAREYGSTITHISQSRYNQRILAVKRYNFTTDKPK